MGGGRLGGGEEEQAPAVEEETEEFYRCDAVCCDALHAWSRGAANIAELAGKEDGCLGVMQGEPREAHVCRMIQRRRSIEA